MRQALVLAATLLCLACAPAHATWENAQLVSINGLEQGLDDAASPRISDDGRYVAFTSNARNFTGTDALAQSAPEGQYRRGGVYRKDLTTNELQIVAPGPLYDDANGQLVRAGASLPSISAIGRYVAFQTPEALVGQDNNGVSDVYVRDMEVPMSAAGAFVLVSAFDGGDAPPSNASSMGLGQQISDDGRTVVFRTSGQTNLPSGGQPVSGAQIFLRDLNARRTFPVNVKRDPTTGQMTSELGGTGEIANPDPVLSGDGSTVVWPGDAVGQARRVGGESTYDVGQFLWRRVGDGPSAPTRIVAAVGDPDDPGCAADGGLSSEDGPIGGPCDGFFANPGPRDLVTTAPAAVSDDGWTVAFATPLYTRDFPRDTRRIQGISDAFVADMRPSVPRKTGVRELTREAAQAASQTAEARLSGPVTAVAISGDGRRVGFSTTRIRFVLASPTIIGRTSPSASPTSAELYVIDLPSNTMELVTVGFDGSKPDGAGTTLFHSLSEDGGRIAFSSGAGNLVRGDGNGQNDVFSADRRVETVEPVDQVVPPAPTPPAVEVVRKLRVTAAPMRGGALRLTVAVPGAGTVRASATAKASKRAKRGKRAAKPIATAEARAARAGKVRLLLRLKARKLRRKPLNATIAVTFVSPPYTALRRSVRARFPGAAR